MLKVYNGLQEKCAYISRPREISDFSKIMDVSTKTDPIIVYITKEINSNCQVELSLQSMQADQSEIKTSMIDDVMYGLDDVKRYFFLFNSTVPRELTAAQFFRINLEKEIRKIAEECKEPNWDSEDALPVQDIDQSLNFIQSLPLSFIHDYLTLFPFPDGSIYFQWRKNKGNYIGVSVGKESFVFNFKNKSGDKVKKGHGVLNDIQDILKLVEKYG